MRLTEDVKEMSIEVSCILSLNSGGKVQEQLYENYDCKCVSCYCANCNVFILKTGSNSNVINYEVNVQNKYSSWQTELESKEAKLKEKEKELNSREAELESKQSLKSSSQQSTK